MGQSAPGSVGTTPSEFGEYGTMDDMGAAAAAATPTAFDFDQVGFAAQDAMMDYSTQEEDTDTAHGAADMADMPGEAPGYSFSDEIDAMGQQEWGSAEGEGESSDAPSSFTGFAPGYGLGIDEGGDVEGTDFGQTTLEDFDPGFGFGEPDPGSAHSFDPGFGDTGGDGGGGGGSSVICTELLKQGLLSQELYQSAHSDALLSTTSYVGYHYWAIPVVRLMRRNKTVTNFFKPLATAWCVEMAHYINPTKYTKRSLFGKYLRIFGEPACYLLGLIVEKKDYKALQLKGDKIYG